MKNNDFDYYYQKTINKFEKMGIQIDNEKKEFILLVAKHYLYSGSDMYGFFKNIYFNSCNDPLYLYEDDFSFSTVNFAVSPLFLSDNKLVLYFDSNLYQVLMLRSRYYHISKRLMNNNERLRSILITKILRYLIYKEWVDETHQYNVIELIVHSLLYNKNLVEFCKVKGIDINNLDYPRIEYIINNIDNFNNSRIIK